MVKMGLVLGLVAMVAGCVHDRGPQTDSGATLTEDAATSPIVDAGAADAGPVACSSDEDCDDGIECTLDACVFNTSSRGPRTVCLYTGLASRCELGAECIVGVGCEQQWVPCESAAECDDGDPCNGSERCGPAGLTYNVCLEATPPENTPPGCDGTCRLHAECDDGDPCNGSEECHDGCQPGEPPETPPEGC